VKLGLAVCSLLTLVAAPLSGQTIPASQEDRKQAIAVRVGNDVIRVNGRLDEPVWKQAPAIDTFVQKEPTEGATPSEQMEVRFVYDADALYVGARMYKQPGLPIQAPMGRRDRGEQSEHILVAIDTFLDHRTAYVFGVTAGGVRIDRYHAIDDETTYDEGFDPVWQATTTVDEQGWTAELWIPFSQLRFNPQERLVWGLNIHRFTPTFNEDDYWVLIPRTVRAWASRFGELRGIEGLTSNRRLELMPYIAESATVNSSRDPANPFDDGRNLRSRLGADIKMGLGPNLTLDATVNPDFGQVEADPAEVNLTAFETRFAEKRPFFSEGAKLFELSNNENFFYSRRIGAAPTFAVAGDFVDYPQNTTILGAAKLTGRLPSGTSIGALGATTGEQTARAFNRAQLTTGSVRVAPNATFGVARVQQEFGRNRSTVSGMTTFVHRDLGAGDPLAQVLARNAFTVASDAVLRFKGGEYELTPLAGATLVTGDPAAIARIQRTSAHYAQRPDKHYAIYDPTRTSYPGYMFETRLNRVSGAHWIWSIRQEFQSPSLETNDIGRITAADGRNTNIDVRYRETTPGKVFRSYWVGVAHNSEWDYGGDRQNLRAQLYTNQTWKNFWTTQLTYSQWFRSQDWRLTRGGPMMETPARWTADFQLKSRPSGQTSWTGQFTVAATEDGGLTNQFVGHLSVRPGPRWQLAVDPHVLRQVDTQQYVATLDGGRPDTFGKRYVFGTIDRSTYSIQFRLGYTLKPDVNVDLYAEPFAASGRYPRLGELARPRSREILPGSFNLPDNNFNVRSFRSNVVLRWEYRPGSTLYLVWQQNRRVSEILADRVSLTDPFRSLTAPGTNYFIVKTSFWLPVR
jgi:hypothetical protein